MPSFSTLALTASLVAVLVTAAPCASDTAEPFSTAPYAIPGNGTDSTYVLGTSGLVSPSRSAVGTVTGPVFTVSVPASSSLPQSSSTATYVKATSKITSSTQVVASTKATSSKPASLTSSSVITVKTTPTTTLSATSITTSAAVSVDSVIQAAAAAPASCTVSMYSQVSAAVASCTAIVLSNIAVPAGVTLDLSSVKSGASITFEGAMTWGYKEWAGPLLQISGSDLTVTGASGSVLDGQGALWWDGKGSNGGKTKPKFFKLSKVTNSHISGITIKNSPVQVFSVSGCTTVTLDSITVNNAAGDTGGGHNTDAFDVGTSSGITISNAKVYNQDDCLAINSGTDITFTGGYCSGGHGLSIGSVGGRSDNTVNNVKITNSQVVNSENGVRIKTVSGATGSVSGITYSNITLSGITKNGIVIEQDYLNGGPTGTPTSGVPITGLTVSGITGTVVSGAQHVYILCASCSGWSWSGVSITGGSIKQACEGIPSGASCS